MRRFGVVIRFDLHGFENDEEAEGDAETANRNRVADQLDEISARLRTGDVAGLPFAYLTGQEADVAALRDEGVVLEANRRFFHPIGLALSVAILNDGSQHVCGFLESRDPEDPTGWLYGAPSSKAEARERRDKARRFQSENRHRLDARARELPWRSPEQPLVSLMGEYALELAEEELTPNDLGFLWKLREQFQPGEPFVVGAGGMLVSAVGNEGRIGAPPQGSGIVARLVAARKLVAGQLPGIPGTSLWLPKEGPGIPILTPGTES